MEWGGWVAVDPNKRTKSWTPNPEAIQHLYKPVVQHSTTKKPLKTLAYACN